MTAAATGGAGGRGDDAGTAGTDAAGAPGRPFDGAAAGYDPSFAHTRLGRWLREAVWRELPFAAGDRVLDLGCGTGEDAVWLARRGVRVVAVDASATMCATARAKAADAGVGGRVAVRRLDLESVATASDLPPADLPPADVHDGPGPPAPGESGATTDDGCGEGSAALYDGALSNFGALNGLASRSALAAALAARLRPGARVVLVLMGPLCPWEIARHAVAGHPRVALRRLRQGGEADVPGGGRIAVWYPTPARLRAELTAAGFRPVRTVGLGTVLPPTSMAGLVERHAGAFARLRPLERRLSRSRPGPWIADHYVAIFERDGERDGVDARAGAGAPGP